MPTVSSWVFSEDNMGTLRQAVLWGGVSYPRSCQTVLNPSTKKNRHADPDGILLRI
jgi:hypothetical protein